MKAFARREDITKEIILDFLRELGCSSCKAIRRVGLFAEEEFEFETSDDLLDKIFEDLGYQENIARSALTISPQGGSVGIQSYSWEM